MHQRIPSKMLPPKVFISVVGIKVSAPLPHLLSPPLNTAFFGFTRVDTKKVKTYDRAERPEVFLKKYSK